MKKDFIVYALTTAMAFGQSTDQRLKERIDSMVVAQMINEKVVGISLGIVRNGNIFYNKGYGVKKLNATNPVDSITNFHLASISKVFVATAIMQLAEQRKLSLDAKLLDFIEVSKLRDPCFREITVRQMLMHTSGIPDVRFYHWNRPKNDSLALGNYARNCIESKNLLFMPGSKWSYSNMAYEMLGHVVEVVSKKPFDLYEREQVLSVSGMQHSNFDYHMIDTRRRSSPHVKRLGKVRVSKIYLYNREHGPSSTLNSCTYDMCSWIIEMLNIYVDTAGKGSGVLRHETLTDMWRPKFKIDNGVSNGLGWILIESPPGLCAAHDGGDRGYGSSLVIFPQHKIGVIMLVNGDYARGIYDLPSKIAWVVKDSLIAKIPADKAYLQLLTGDYAPADQVKQKVRVTLTATEEELACNFNGNKFMLTPVGGERFMNRDGVSFQFDSSDRNAVTAQVVGFGTLRLKKVK